MLRFGNNDDSEDNMAEEHKTGISRYRAWRKEQENTIDVG